MADILKGGDNDSVIIITIDLSTSSAENSTVEWFVHTKLYYNLPLFLSSAIYAYESIGFVRRFSI